METEHRSAAFGLPLWYRVSQKQLSYSNFFERFRNPLFTEQETFQLFLLITFYEHDPYIDNSHIIHRLMSPGSIREKELQLFYLYRTFRPNSDKELIVQGAETTITSIEIRLPHQFEEELQSLLKMTLRGLFDLGHLQLNLDRYQPGDVVQLQRILSFNERFGEQFKLTQITVESLYQIMQLHGMLLDLQRFLRGEDYPRYLQSFRRDQLFVQTIFKSYSPYLLLGLIKGGEITEDELKLLYQYHQDLYEQSHVDFYLYYVDQMRSVFGDSLITAKLSEYVALNNDQYLANKFLRGLPPSARCTYFLQRIYVTDNQLDRLLKEIADDGIESVLKKRVLYNKENIRRSIEQAGYQLQTEATLGLDSIYLYSEYDLIWYVEENGIYLFLEQEMVGIVNGKGPKVNPYTRKPLPEIYLKSKYRPGLRQSIEGKWSNILRRKIDLSF